MNEKMFLSSMESERFSGVFECNFLRKVELHGRRHAVIVSCSPPVLAQDLGYPEGLTNLLLANRFEGDDIWSISSLPFFVYICLYEGSDAILDSPQIIAWGELYETVGGAATHQIS